MVPFIRQERTPENFFSNLRLDEFVIFGRALILDLLIVGRRQEAKISDPVSLLVSLRCQERLWENVVEFISVAPKKSVTQIYFRVGQQASRVFRGQEQYE